MELAGGVHNGWADRSIVENAGGIQNAAKRCTFVCRLFAAGYRARSCSLRASSGRAVQQSLTGTGKETIYGVA